eukprot:scaffold48707_cov65-Phaeocystis_antarctica.AAC.4
MRGRGLLTRRACRMSRSGGRGLCRCAAAAGAAAAGAGAAAGSVVGAVVFERHPHAERHAGRGEACVAAAAQPQRVARARQQSGHGVQHVGRARWARPHGAPLAAVAAAAVARASVGVAEPRALGALIALVAAEGGRRQALALQDVLEQRLAAGLLRLVPAEAEAAALLPEDKGPVGRRRQRRLSAVGPDLAPRGRA